MILGGREQIVCNKAARECFWKIQQEKKEIIQVDEGCHLMLADKEFYEMVAKLICNYFDAILEVKDDN